MTPGAKRIEAYDLGYEDGRFAQHKPCNYLPMYAAWFRDAYLVGYANGLHDWIFAEPKPIPAALALAA